MTAVMAKEVDGEVVHARPDARPSTASRVRAGWASRHAHAHRSPRLSWAISGTDILPLGREFSAPDWQSCSKRPTWVPGAGAQGGHYSI